MRITKVLRYLSQVYYLLTNKEIDQIISNPLQEYEQPIVFALGGSKQLYKSEANILLFKRNDNHYEMHLNLGAVIVSRMDKTQFQHFVNACQKMLDTSYDSLEGNANYYQLPSYWSEEMELKE